MYDWVRALLDPTDISQSTPGPKKQSTQPHITPPPKFDLPPPPAEFTTEPRSTRTRSRRSASPTKAATSRSSARSGKHRRAAHDDGATESLQSSLDASANIVESETIEETVETEVSVNGDVKPSEATKPRKSKKAAAATPSEAPPAEDEKVPVNGESTEDVKDVEAEADASTGEPSLLPELPPDANPKTLLAEAKEMVEKAKENLSTEDGPAEPSTEKAATKRKTDDLSEDEKGGPASEEQAQRAKRAKVLEDKLKRERVRNRALVGVTAALAIA